MIDTSRLFILVASLTPDMRAMVINHLTIVLSEAAAELHGALSSLPHLNRAMPAVENFAARVDAVRESVAEAACFVEEIGGAR